MLSFRPSGEGKLMGTG